MMIVAGGVFVRLPVGVAVVVIMIMPMIVVMPVIMPGMFIMLTMGVLETWRNRDCRIRLRV